MSDLILTEILDQIATITLNRPEKLNALTLQSWRLLGETMRTLSGQAELRCIIIKGAGERAFSPGNDISEFETERASVEQATAYGQVMCQTLQAFRECPVPIVAQIRGICVGGGLEIAAMCDLRICSRSSRFGAPINRLGLVMAYGELQGLMELGGAALARELLLEGRIINADEAYEKNIITRIVSDDKLDSEVGATARRIAAGAPLVARWHKKFIRRLADPTPLSNDEIAEGYACFGTEDYQIGYHAFLEKTEPAFKGR